MTGAQGTRRPLCRRWWFWLLIVLGVAVVASVAAGGAAQQVTAPSTAPSTTATTPSASPEPSVQAVQPTPQPPDTDPLSDNGWTASDIRVSQTPFGLTLTARVTNTAGELRAGGFTITLLRNGLTVATATGAANDVEAGGTATVTFLSTDTLTDGAEGIDFEFQANY